MAKEQITIEIITPETMTTTEAIRLFADAEGYQKKIHNTTTGRFEDNPETRRAFAKRFIATYIKNRIKSFQQEEAMRALSLAEVDVQ